MDLQSTSNPTRQPEIPDSSLWLEAREIGVDGSISKVINCNFKRQRRNMDRQIKRGGLELEENKLEHEFSGRTTK